MLHTKFDFDWLRRCLKIMVIYITEAEPPGYFYEYKHNYSVNLVLGSKISVWKAQGVSQ